MSSRRTFLAGTGITGLIGATFRGDALARAAAPTRMPASARRASSPPMKITGRRSSELLIPTARSSTSTTAVFAPRQPTFSTR